MRPFREAEEIRNDVLLLAGKQGAGAAEAGHDLVEDEVDAVGIAPIQEGGEHAGGPWAHFVDALDEGRDDDWGEVSRREGGEFVEAADVVDGKPGLRMFFAIC